MGILSGDWLNSDSEVTDDKGDSYIISSSPDGDSSVYEQSWTGGRGEKIGEIHRGFFNSSSVTVKSGKGEAKVESNPWLGNSVYSGQGLREALDKAGRNAPSNASEARSPSNASNMGWNGPWDNPSIRCPARSSKTRSKKPSVLKRIWWWQKTLPSLKRVAFWLLVIIGAIIFFNAFEYYIAYALAILLVIICIPVALVIVAFLIFGDF